MQPQPQSVGDGPPPQAGAAAGLPHAVTHGPAFAMLRVDLAPGQTLVAEAGAMVAKHDHVSMRAKLNAGPRPGVWAALQALFVALVRKLIGGETFFVTHFGAPRPGSVWLAPVLAGQIRHRRLQGERLVLSTGAYLAHVGDVDIKLRFGGLRALFAKEGLFFLEVQGHGELWFTSYGGIHAVEVDGTYVVDNGHLVGFEGPLDFAIRGAGGGVLGFFASGEGIVLEFRGRGRVYLQSRSLGSLVGWLSPMLPR
ncbi:MAG: TIGR00266 family protein [Myxococcota bacterium]